MSSVLYKHPYEKGKEDGIAEGMVKGMEKSEEKYQLGLINVSTVGPIIRGLKNDEV